MRDKIMAMKAGAILDSFVAEDIMGWEVGGVDHNGERQYLKDGLIQNCTIDGTYAWEPSTDISAAWEIIGLFREKPYPEAKRFLKELNELLTTNDGHLIAWPDALLFLKPVHICKAALLSVMDS